MVSPLINPEVSGALSTVNLSDSEAPILPALSIIMDSKNISSKVKGLENFAAGIDMLIERFNPETVTVLDKDDYKAELSSIFSKLTEMQGKVNTLTESLDESKEEHRNAIGKVTALFNNAKTKVVSNEKQVKLQMVKLVNESEASRNSRVADDELKKLTLRVKNAEKKFKDLEKEVSELTDVSSMSENEIRESLVTSKEWKKDLKSFQDLKEKSQNCVKAAIAFVCTTCKRQLFLHYCN